MTYNRWQKQNLKEALETWRIGLLIGSRQCGKTTLAKEFSQKDSIYLTLDDPSILAAAQNDPVSFVQNSHQLTIIDEVQRAPILLPTIKKVVDENLRPGQFLLTGSSDIQSLPTTHESLAGRVRKIRLRPLTRGEIFGVDPTFLQRAFNDSFKQSLTAYTRDDILEFIFLGGFPEVQQFSEKNRKLWFIDYINAILDRDLKDITRITQRATAVELIHTVAAWSSKILDMTSIAANLSASRPTIESYLHAIELTFLVERIYPWTRSDYSRIGRRHKIMMGDSGMMCALLNLGIDKTRFDPDRLGKLFETFVYQELVAQVEAHPGQYSIFHFRDRDHHEIDFLITGEDDSFLGIEVKASSTVGVNDFKNLKWFQANITPNKNFRGIVLYAGQQVLSFGPHLKAVPISSFWER